MAEERSLTDTRLREVARYEATVRRTPFTRLARTAGRTKIFAAGYRRIGPRMDRWLMRTPRGRRVAGLYGLPVLLLDTVGSRTGLTRTSPLLYLRDGDDFAVVGTNFGQLHHPAWTGNLLRQPRAEIGVGPVRLPVTAELAEQAAWDRLWPRFCAVYPGYTDYLQRCGGRTPRLFLLHPTEHPGR